MKTLLLFTDFHSNARCLSFAQGNVSDIPSGWSGITLELPVNCFGYMENVFEMEIQALKKYCFDGKKVQWKVLMVLWRTCGTTCNAIELDRA